MGDLIFQLGVPAFLLLLGLIVGKTVEQRHLRSIERRERALSRILVTDIKTFPPAVEADTQASLVMGDVVIATDYLKTFLAKLRNLIGGEVKSFQTLLIRARREAILRMIDEAQHKGYNAVCNVRLDTADIGAAVGSRGAAMVEVLATGTAYRIPPEARA